MIPRLTQALSFAEYLALPSAHMSTLKAMAISPLHYRHACISERVDTSALRVGRLTHAMILAPPSAAPYGGPPEDFVIFPGPTRRGKAWDAFVEEHPTATIVKRDEVDRAESMRHAVASHGPAVDLLSDGAGEVTVEWARHGVSLRGRLDWLGSRGLVELKSTRAISSRDWQREVENRYYLEQVGVYSDGVRAVAAAGEIGAFAGDHGMPIGWPGALPVHWIVVENQAPFDVAVYRVHPADVLAGWRSAEGWIKQVAECTESGRWPGVGGSGVVEYERAPWAALGSGEDLDISLDGEVV